MREEPEHGPPRDAECLGGASVVVGAPELVEIIAVTVREDVGVPEAPLNHEASHLVPDGLGVAGEERDRCHEATVGSKRFAGLPRAHREEVEWSGVRAGRLRLNRSLCNSGADSGKSPRAPTVGCWRSGTAARCVEPGRLVVVEALQGDLPRPGAMSAAASIPRAEPQGRGHWAP